MPRPSKANRANESSRGGMPAVMSNAPRTLNDRRLRSGGWSRQRVIPQGTIPAKNPGAISRKANEPQDGVAAAHRRRLL